MDKRIALIKLIVNSFVISDKTKKVLLQKVEFMTDEEVEKLGKFLVTERQLLLENESRLIDYVENLVEYLQKTPKR